jgi:hypothetical protein
LKETSDAKILESVIENQSALTAKSVVETLRADASFAKTTSPDLAALSAKLPKDSDDRLIGHLAGVASQAIKIWILSTLKNSLKIVAYLFLHSIGWIAKG